MSGDPELFRDFHRRRWLVSTAKRLAVLAGAAALVAAVAGLAAGAPDSPIDELSIGEVQVPGAPVNTVVESLPEPAQGTAVEPEAAQTVVLAAAGETRHWDIDIDTVGYQAELDDCLWVRMDLGAAAPIVGAHNHCGGDIVLEMGKGDTITLTGASLDGEFVVTDARDAWAGDDAAEATEGMTADVILQTCYWQNNGRELLLGLVRST